MKRTISILLAALLLLIALPTFAEGEAVLQPGLYAADGGKDVLYLDELGGGVLNYHTGEQDLANGVLWTETSLEIERTQVPYAMVGDALVFTFDGAVRVFRYAGEGPDYAMGDREGTAFAGTYLSEGGKKLTLTADGQGVYTDADGESAIRWGSLLPYWSNAEGVTESTCYVLFDSYLSGMSFEGDTAIVNTENEGAVAFVRQALIQPAGNGQLYYGYRMTADGQTVDLIPFLNAIGMDPKSIYLELRPDGTGTLQFMDEDEKADFTWTEDTLTYGGESVPYTREGDHILISIEGESIEFAPAAEMEALLGGTQNDSENKTTIGIGNAGSDGLVGTWTFTKAKAMGMEIPASTMGTEMSIVLNEDGTAALITDGSATDLEWSLKDEGTIVLSVAGTVIFTLTYDGTILTLDTGAGGVEMLFEKGA